jgi:hypothetical protein
MSEDQHKANGLVQCYFPNGTAFDMFYDSCARCRHCTDNLENPQPGRMTAPFANCGWGVLDRIYVAMTIRDRDHASHWHDPADLEVKDEDGSPRCPPLCKRFTPKGYDGDDRDPPRPDLPGQMFIGEIDIPIERVPEAQGASK